jgi:hypothetical protein
MKPDNQQTSGSYIGRILIDGATPFLYRSAVRYLLGIPENRIGNTVVRQNLPLSGFRYAYSQNGIGFNSDSIELGIEGSAKAQKGQEEMPISQYQRPIKNHPNSLKADTDLEHKSSGVSNILDTLSNQAYKRNDEQPISKGDVQILSQKNVKKLKTQTPETKEENTAVPIDKSQVNIPGITKRKQHYPVVTPTNNEVAQREAKLEQNTLTNRKTAILPGSPGVADQKKPVQKVAISKTNGENETGDYAPASGIIKDQTILDKVNFSSEKSNRSLSDFKIPENNLPISGEVAVNSIEHSKAHLINRESIRKMVYRTNKDNTKQIEQLKHTVNELAAKNSELESQIYKNKAQTEKQQRNLPATKEPVIVQQPAKVTQTPSAFWERSYLNRFHLKMLR